MAKWYEKMGSELSKLGKEVGKGAKVAAVEVGKGAKVVGREVGKGAKVAASEVRKTVGIGVGEIKIDLGKRQYALGDTVTGALELELSEPTRAKRLVVEIEATRKRISYSTNAAGRKTQDTHTETLHNFELELAGEQEFESGRFEFELPLPAEVASARPEIKTEGVIGDVARVVSSVASANTTSVAWTISACLDIPWKRNVSADIDIAVS